MAEVGFAAMPEQEVAEPEAQGEVEGEAQEVQQAEAESPIEAGDASEEKEVEGEAEQPKGGRAQRRIQQLAAKAKELEQQIAQRDAQHQQYIQYLQQQRFQEEQKISQERLEIERHRLEAEQARARREEEANLSDLEKWRRSVVHDAKSEVERAANSRVEVLEKRLQDMESQRKSEIEMWEAKQRTEMFQRKAEAEGTRAVLGALLPEDRNKLVQETGNLVMTWAAANGVDPSIAAPAFNQFLDKLVAARIKATANTAKKTVKTNPPSVISSKVPQAKEEKPSQFPSPEELRMAGYDNIWHWLENGQKPIQKGIKNAGR
jgi:hypothetical protein